MTRKDRPVVYKFTTYDVALAYTVAGMQRNYAALIKHLNKAFHTGIPDRPTSPSQMKKLIIEKELAPSKADPHPFCAFAFFAGYEGQGNKQHDIVQSYFHQHCLECIATEMPVWNDEISGCVDIVLYDKKEDKVILLDFKPNAHKESKAATQLFYYKKLLVEQTGITNVECYYFDKDHCYRVKI